MTPEEIVAKLEKLGRASRVQLGTDQKTMEALEAAGVVAQDGTISTGNRGRPPIAWILADKSKTSQVEGLPGTIGRGNPEQVKAMHEGKRKAASKRIKAERKSKEEELKQLKSTDLFDDYAKALETALKKDTDKHWQLANQLQNAIIGQNNRIRTLEKELA